MAQGNSRDWGGVRPSPAAARSARAGGVGLSGVAPRSTSLRPRTGALRPACAECDRPRPQRRAHAPDSAIGEGLTARCPCSADFQVCCIAGFQTREPSCHPQPFGSPHAPETPRPLPIWKSAIRQVWKPALRDQCADARPKYRRLPSLLYRGFPNPRAVLPPATLRLAARARNSAALPIWKSAIRQVWKPALQGALRGHTPSEAGPAPLLPPPFSR